MKKTIALLLALALCLGLLAGCGSTAKETVTPAPDETGPVTVESLKIAFSPYADADEIITSTQPLEDLLKAKLLEIRG